MKNRQIDNKKTSKQVRISLKVHQHLKIEACKANKTIKEYLEEILGDYLENYCE